MLGSQALREVDANRFSFHSKESVGRHSQASLNLSVLYTRLSLTQIGKKVETKPIDKSLLNFPLKTFY